MIKSLFSSQFSPLIRSMIGRGGAWSPLDITTLGWYDPSRESTITSATNLVSQIDDIGTSGTEHLIQGTVGKQMSTGLQTINSLNVLSSITPTRLMENLTFPIPASGNIAISFVAKIDGQSANSSTSLISMDSPANKDWQLMAANTTQFDGALNATSIGSYDVVSGGPYTGPHIWTMVFDFDSMTKKIFIDGVERSSGTYTTAMDLVQKLRIFANRGGAQPVFGLFGEMIITEDVSEATRANACNYLTTKWLNLSPNLVANGDFGNGTTDWISRGGAALSVTSGVMEVTDTTGSLTAAATQIIDLVAGKTYLFSCEGRSVVGTSTQFIIEWTGGGDADNAGTSSAAFQPLEFEFTPTHTSGDGGFNYQINLREDNNNAGDIAEFKNVSVREKL